MTETCVWCEDWADGFDPDPCPKHHPDIDADDVPDEPPWLPGTWPELRDN